MNNVSFGTKTQCLDPKVMEQRIKSHDRKQAVVLTAAGAGAGAVAGGKLTDVIKGKFVKPAPVDTLLLDAPKKPGVADKIKQYVDGLTDQVGNSTGNAKKIAKRELKIAKKKLKQLSSKVPFNKKAAVIVGAATGLITLIAVKVAQNKASQPKEYPEIIFNK